MHVILSVKWFPTSNVEPNWVVPDPLCMLLSTQFRVLRWLAPCTLMELRGSVEAHREASLKILNICMCLFLSSADNTRKGVSLLQFFVALILLFVVLINCCKL